MAISRGGAEISSINKKDFPKKGNKILKIIDILHEFYGDFDFIKEKWNEDYEGLLIKTKEEQKYKRCRLAKRTPKKEGYFTVFWKKDQNNNNVPYTNEDLGDELVIVVIDSYNSGLFIIPKEVAVNKRILSTRDSKGKMAMRFYPPWCTNLNKTAQSTQKWQLEYFRSYKIGN